jgi:hypothetical protein
VTTRRSKKSRILSAGPAGVSWVALVAATALGIPAVQRVRAAVTADPRELGGESGDGYRLIVQSYAPSSLRSGQLPAGRARPLASTQRAITPEQLRRGIAVDMVGIDSTPDSPEGRVIIAWVERGLPDLDFDGLQARPAADAFYGVAVADSVSPGATPVVLKRHRAG